MWDVIEECVPGDSAAQVTPEWVVGRVRDQMPKGALVLDLGCGAGRSKVFFEAVLPGCTWIGVDIEDSPEIKARSVSSPAYRSFDGINIPLPAASADIVFSRQVLEHVRYPERLLADVHRVLKNGGLFIGSTSHLEPYHSFQFWNFTPYGFKRIIEDAGLKLLEIRPGIDGVTLVQRTFDGRPKSYSKYFGEESPLNMQIDAWSRDTGRSVKQTLVRKLSVCGQFCFLCCRQDIRP